MEDLVDEMVIDNITWLLTFHKSMSVKEAEILLFNMGCNIDDVFIIFLDDCFQIKIDGPLNLPEKLVSIKRLMKIQATMED